MELSLKEGKQSVGNGHRGVLVIGVGVMLWCLWQLWILLWTHITLGVNPAMLVLPFFIALLWGIAGASLLRKKKWARIFLIFLMSSWLAVSAFLLVGYFSFRIRGIDKTRLTFSEGDMFIRILLTCCMAMSVYYLTRPDVRNFFKKRGRGIGEVK